MPRKKIESVNTTGFENAVAIVVSPDGSRNEDFVVTSVQKNTVHIASLDGERVGTYLLVSKRFSKISYFFANCSLILKIKDENGETKEVVL